MLTKTFIIQYNKVLAKNVLNSTAREVEYQMVCQALLNSKGNVSSAAKSLGMSRQNFQYRLRRYQIDVQVLLQKNLAL